jgi:hypothetical protein
VLARVEIERRVAGRRLHGIIIGEFYRGEVEIPVSVPGVHIGSKSFFDHPVHALGLTVGLGVKGGREGQFGTQQPEKGTCNGWTS